MTWFSSQTMSWGYNNKSTSLDLREERSQNIRKTRPSCPWLKKKKLLFAHSYLVQISSTKGVPVPLPAALSPT